MPILNKEQRQQTAMRVAPLQALGQGSTRRSERRRQFEDLLKQPTFKNSQGVSNLPQRNISSNISATNTTPTNITGGSSVLGSSSSNIPKFDFSGSLSSSLTKPAMSSPIQPPSQPQSLLDARKSFEDALKAEQDFKRSVQLGQAAISDRPQPLTDIQGQLASQERRTAIQTGVFGDATDRTQRQFQFEQEQAQAMQPSSDPFTLSEGQIRFDAQGNVIAQGPQDISDTEFGSSQFGQNNQIGTLSNAASFLAPAIGAANQREAFQSAFQGMSARGDIEGMQQLLLRTAIETIPSADLRDKMSQRNEILMGVNEVSKLLEEFEANGGQTGLLVGRKQNIKEKLGKVGNPELARIGNDILFLVDQLGKSQSGAALNENEEKIYRALFPSGSRSNELNRVKIESLNNSLSRSIENTLSTQLGSAGYQAIQSALSFTGGSNQQVPQGYQQVTGPNGEKGFLGPDGQIYKQEEIMSFSQNSSSNAGLGEFMNRIAGVESGGNYAALGPVQNDGHRAVGKYQIMTFNIPQWSREALGQEITPQQFRDNPQLQESIAAYQMNKLYQKYGNWADVASAWHSGVPLAQAQSRRDSLGTATPNYVRKVLA